jgi:hypothetical protein
VIIDEGSCNNLVSTELVQNLDLSTRPHPYPYHIQWLNDSGKAKVIQTCRVHFSIGAYVDCDVVPIQACSRLLGHPWEHDNDALHHGRSNKYTFMHKGMKITLLPFDEDINILDIIISSVEILKALSHDHEHNN